MFSSAGGNLQLEDKTATFSATLLSGLNPLLKLACVAVVALGLTFVFDPLTPAVVFVIAVVIARFLGGLNVKTQLRPLAIFLVVGLAILVANIFFNKENQTSETLIAIGYIRITKAALWAAGSLWMRIICFAHLSFIYFKTTPPQDLILSVVHQLKVNYRVAFSVLVGYRMLPVFQEEYRVIRAAQRVRGIRDRRGRVNLVLRTVRYALPLLASAIRKANRLALAMEARAFGAFAVRTYRRQMVVSAKDWVVFACVVVFLSTLLWVFSHLGIAKFALW